MEAESKKQNGKAEDAGNARIAVIVVAAMLAAVAAYLLLTAPKTLPGWNKPVLSFAALTLFFAAAAAVAALALARVALHRERRKILRGVKRLVLSAVSIAVCIVAFDLVCTAFPTLQKSFVRPDTLALDNCRNDPKYGYRGTPNHSETIPVGGPYGDLAPRGEAPKSAAGEKQISGTLRSDANAFPNSNIPAQADVIIVGDSFAYEMLMSEGKHWMTAIRESVKSAYNIAAPGWGPMQEWLALEEFGLPLKPKVVVWAFCEGNDLLDAELFQTFNERPDKSLTWADFQAIRFGLPPQRFPYNRPFVRLLLSLAERLNPPPPAAAGGEENAGPVVIEAKNGASAVGWTRAHFTRCSRARPASATVSACK